MVDDGFYTALELPGECFQPWHVKRTGICTQRTRRSPEVAALAHKYQGDVSCRESIFDFSRKRHRKSQCRTKESSLKGRSAKLLKENAKLASDYEYRCSGVSPLLEEKCANCAEGELFCIPQTCTKEEINQRKAVQSKRKRAPLIKRATMMAENKCQACFNNRASCSGASSTLEERCVRCEKRKLHCIPRGCTEEVSDQRRTAQFQLVKHAS